MMSNGTELAPRDDDQDVMLVQNDVGMVASLNRSEIEAQVATAHRWPRSLQRFLHDAQSLIALDQETAQSCYYTLKRREGGGGEKIISGPSVRLAEIAASSWGNMHCGGRPMEVGDTNVVAQGVAWDLERNVRVTVEATRRITTKNGGRYGDDMINTTMMAAISIALRNAVLRVIPRSLIKKLENHARRVAVGEIKSIAETRQKLMERFAAMGVEQARVLAHVGKEALADVGMAEIEHLIGVGTALKEGRTTLDEQFPAAAPPAADPAKEGQRLPLGARGRAKEASSTSAAPPEAKGEASTSTKPGELPLGEKKDRDPGAEG
jgi:hypothetical protein